MKQKKTGGGKREEFTWTMARPIQLPACEEICKGKEESLAAGAYRISFKKKIVGGYKVDIKTEDGKSIAKDMNVRSWWEKRITDPFNDVVIALKFGWFYPPDFMVTIVDKKDVTEDSIIVKKGLFTRTAKGRKQLDNLELQMYAEKRPFKPIRYMFSFRLSGGQPEFISGSFQQIYELIKGTGFYNEAKDLLKKIGGAMRDPDVALDNEFTAEQYLCLVALLDGPMYFKTIRRLGKMNPFQTGSALAELDEMGIIEEIDGDSGKKYALTDKGRDEVSRLNQESLELIRSRMVPLRLVK